MPSTHGRPDSSLGRRVRPARHHGRLSATQVLPRPDQGGLQHVRLLHGSPQGQNQGQDLLRH